MQPPLARRRVRLTVAVTVTALGGSLLMSAGTSSSATAPAAASFVGPRVAAPAALPLVRTDGPLLPAPVRPPLTPVLRPMGPPASARTSVGPAGLIGPASPLAQVRGVQRLLNARGADLRVDGAWGPATTRAVRRVQVAAGLPATGRVDPRTAAALRD